MKFYNTKFKELRKKKKITMQALCQKIKIGNTTLWEWERGNKMPNEMQIRMMAEILEVSVKEISDLKQYYRKSEIDISNTADSLLHLAELGGLSKANYDINNAINGIINLKHQLINSSIIIKAIMSSMKVAFYIKDFHLNYILTNDLFLKNIGLRTSYDIRGKNDNDFFSRSEAKKNTEIDLDVIFKGKTFTEETFIPGTRKRKWGIISKEPIFDLRENISGMTCTITDITNLKKNV